MENKYMTLNLTKNEINLLQLVLAHYIVENRNKKAIKEYVEDAKILLDNINFYDRQKNN